MEDREFNRLRIENTDGQIHTQNDAAHTVEELPLRAVAEREDFAEAYRADETGATERAPEPTYEAATNTVKAETHTSAIQMAATASASAPIVAALAVAVSAILVVTSVVNSLSVKVALQMKTAFSLIFSLVIQNPDEEPLFAVLSADGQDDIVRPLQADDTELAFENLQPATKYTLKILKIVQGDEDREIRETLFEKYYYTERGDGQQPPVVYTVTEEEWNAAFAPASFDNVTVRRTSYYEENGRIRENDGGETVIVMANGYMLQLSEGWIDVRPVEEGGDTYEFSRMMEGLSYADFTFDEASNLYRYTQQTEGEEIQGKDQLEQSSSVVRYAVGFQNGKLVSYEQTYEDRYGESDFSTSVSRCTFENYGTSFVTVIEADGIGYVTSSANETLTAYEWIDWESTEVRIPAEINGIAVTGLGYLFNGSENLSTVYLPGTLTNLGYNFSNCPNLSAIHYDGTREQWNTLAENFYIQDTITVYCTDGMIPE